MLPTQGDTLLLDSGFIERGSIEIAGYSSPSDFVQYKNYIIWTAKSPSDSISVSYRKLRFSITYQHKDVKIIQRTVQDNPFSYTPESGNTLIEYGNLSTAGNVSRGIGFGNAQDVVVNSNLNLRIRGKLANDVDVLAVISDENNPIQPEGNTQQIQDFDQVYITLKKDSGTVTMGDFLMKKPTNSYFLNYYKKSRGLQYTNVTHKDDWRVATQAEVAMSRGRFSRNKIEGIEGNSGPYRLNGTNGELFIVVIAGTETVYLDGKKLKRGEDNDYVINYNTGEITFTPRILITRYSRIVAEFQYSDRNYGRSVAHLGGGATKGKVTIYANAFNEMDLKSQPFLQNLTGYDSLQNKSAYDILEEAGDSLAFFSNAKIQNEFNTDRIMYTKQDLGGVDIFVHAQDPNVAESFYEVSFSNVGINRGDYQQAQTAANGKVFEYVGENMGDYDPIEILIAPKRLNTMNLGIVFRDSSSESGLEYSLSSFDNNSLSSLDDSDNQGFGVRLYRKSEKKLSDSSNWTWNNHVSYELVNGGYTYIERYRDVEFDRKWNKVLTNPNSFAQLTPSFEHIGNASFGLKKSNSEYLTNTAALFLRPGNFSGFSNMTKGQYQWNKLRISTSLELMSSETNVEDSSTIDNDFYSFNGALERSFGKMRTGISVISEQSTFRLDSLQNQSYGFEMFKAFVGSTDSSRLRYNLSLAQRSDRLPKNDGFSNSTLGRDVNFMTAYKSKSGQRMEWNTIYRQLEILDTTLSNKPIENTLQSRVELNLHFFKKFIRSRTFYQIGTGQEQRREFQYLKVQPGNGIYMWNDYDSNGLKTLNEFEIASELDRQRADHIKIYTPVAGFITTQTNKISQTLQISPAVLFKKSGSKRPFLSRFNSVSTFILDKKVLPTDIVEFLNPIQESQSDSALINNSKNFRTTVFFNRGNPKYSFDYSRINRSSKVLLTNGFDSRDNQENIVNTRVNLGSFFTLNLKAKEGTKRYESQFFSDNTFQIRYRELEPRLQAVFKKMYRIELRAKYFNALNDEMYGGESSTNLEIGTDFKYAKATKGTFNIGVSYINVDYDGNTSSNLGYELLRGLQNGDNATWNLGYRKTLANNIQVVVSYDGRKSEDAPVIHIGRLVARYLF
ncbi:MAG: hypothetical protein ACPGYY_07560 [Bacteroidia bacterium]